MLLLDPDLIGENETGNLENINNEPSLEDSIVWMSHATFYQVRRFKLSYLIAT